MLLEVEAQATLNRLRDEEKAYLNGQPANFDARKWAGFVRKLLKLPLAQVQFEMIATTTDAIAPLLREQRDRIDSLEARLAALETKPKRQG